MLRRETAATGNVGRHFIDRFLADEWHRADPARRKRPAYGLGRPIDEAFASRPAADDPRKIWFPG